MTDFQIFPLAPPVWHSEMMMVDGRGSYNNTRYRYCIRFDIACSSTVVVVVG